MNLEEDFYKVITENRLFNENESILIAFSAGPDSLCLYYLLKSIQKKMNLTLSLAHINYNLRGAESESEASWIENFAVKEEIPLYQKSIHINSKKNLQEKARDIRYHYFEELYKDRKYNSLALGHHLDDQMETLFIKMLRASSISSLNCMELQSFRRKLSIVRPLLFYTKRQILAYLNENNIFYFTDSSNFKDDYLRNKIRLKILPEIEKAVPDYHKKLQNLIGIFKEQTDFLQKETSKAINRIVKKKESYNYEIALDDFRVLEPLIQKQVLINLFNTFQLSNITLTKHEIERLVKDISLQSDQGSTLLFSKKGMEIIRVYDTLKLIFLENKITKLPLDINNFNFLYTLFLSNNFLELLKVQLVNRAEINLSPEKSLFRIKLDYNKIQNGLNLRHFIQGDRICLNSKIANKKLSDIFIDLKIPKNERSRVVILCDGRKVIGFFHNNPAIHRLSTEYYVTDFTENIVLMDYFIEKSKLNE